MKKAQSINLVIDASVARASGGEEAIHPTAMVTRNFLQAVLTICHKTVMTPAIRAEWDKHQSGFARKWRRSMVARKKLVRLNVEERPDLRQRVELGNISQGEKDAMLKDCHLIEAAINTDRRIISLDDAARKLFVELSLSVTDIQDVLWVNPALDERQVMAWLEGAPNEAKWKLTHNSYSE